jgi:hypothetical protein
MFCTSFRTVTCEIARSAAISVLEEPLGKQAEDLSLSRCELFQVIALGAPSHRQ